MGHGPFPSFACAQSPGSEQIVMTHRVRNILEQIGNTPMVPVRRMNPNREVEILAKLEYFNPGGSVKDRPALYMIEEAERRGELTPDKIILEATSGNTGIGLALVAAVKGYRILLTMSESVSEERVKILRALGAEIHFTPAHKSTDGAIEYVYELVRREPDRYWLADQFNNEANWLAHYHGTAMEIWEATQGRLDAVVATMGTTGTLMGLSRRFKELDPGVDIVGVEPFLGHKIQGLKNMKESYQPGIFDRDRLDRIIHIDDEEAFRTARELARQEGIFVGMSSGAAMAAALRMAGEMPRGRIVVILPDGGERYLSTSLFVSRKKSGLMVYNTLARRAEEFMPLEEDRASVYSTGPTLCEFLGLAQARRYVFADLLCRYLAFRGFRVNHVMNITDLDDRTIEGAEKEGLPLRDFTDRYLDAFLQDMDRLGIRRAQAYPRASEHVEEAIELARRLVDKGYAYEKFRSIYFDISRFKDYGRLSRIDLKKIKVGKTVDLDQYEKENPRDFTLLKRATLEELKRGLFFKTRWGNVRPSWHLGCAAMALKHLGESYDIQTGGMDLIFPHHENTIAILQALTGKPPATYWLHNEMAAVNGEEARLTLRDVFSRGYTGREIRYWLLSRHYRKPIRFSRNKLDTARNTVERLDTFVQKIHFARSGEPDPEIDQAVYDLKHRFTEAMDQDFNIAPALAALFQFIRRINHHMDRKGLAPGDREKIVKILEELNTVLGVMDLTPPAVDEKTEALIQEREDARKNRDWERADRLRDQLKAMGIEVVDTKEGPVWRKTG